MMVLHMGPGPGQALRIAPVEQAQPYFQPRAWNRDAHNYIGPFWEVSLDDGQRVHAGVHFVEQNDYVSIDEFCHSMFGHAAQMQAPINEGDMNALASGRDYVALADGSVYSICLKEGKPFARLLPMRAPELHTERELCRERG